MPLKTNPDTARRTGSNNTAGTNEPKSKEKYIPEIRLSSLRKENPENNFSDTIRPERQQRAERTVSGTRRTETTQTTQTTQVQENAVPIQMDVWRKRCPSKFHTMINKSNVTDIYCRDVLVYEVFPKSKNVDAFSDFVEDELEDVDGKNYKVIGEKTVSEVYEKTWDGIEGAKEPRNLLYPKLKSKGNRIEGEKSEIKALMEMIEETDYFMEEVGENTFFYVIKDSLDDILYYILPCCPKCHTLLPNGWFDKEKLRGYIPVMMVAPPTGGKTTYMSALLMAGNLEACLNTGENNRKWWSITTGIPFERERFRIQETRYKNLDRFTGRNCSERQSDTLKRFPEHTNEHTVLPPVYIAIKDCTGAFNHIELLIGIFDVAGETFKSIGNLDNNVTSFLEKIEGLIYMVEPKNMCGINQYFRETDGEQTEVSQRENHGIFQSDIFNGTEEQDTAQEYSTQRMPEPMLYLSNILEILKRNATFAGARNSIRHIAFTVVKSNLLLDIAEKEKWTEDAELMLFPSYLHQPSEGLDPFEPQGRADRDETIKSFFRRVVIADDMEFRRVTPQYVGENPIDYSWNCVNVAIDTNKEEMSCEHNFVRIADPFVNCFISKVKSEHLDD